MPDKKLHLLFVAPALPRPGFNAGSTKIFEVIRRVSSAHRVSLISFSDAFKPPFIDSLRRHCSYLEILPAPVRRARPLLRPHPGFIDAYGCTEMQTRVCSFVRQEKPDIIQFEYLSMSQYMAPDIKTCSFLALHELDILMLWRLLCRGPGIKDKILAFPKLFKIFAYYRQQLIKFKKIVVFTAKEKAILNKFFPRAEVRVIPMGVDTQYFFCRAAVEEEPIDLLFVGYFKHSPNIEAVRFFCHKIMPLLRKKAKFVKLSIIGADTPHDFKKFEEKGFLEIIGQVDDIRPYFRRAKVFVCPVRTGAGMRGKLLEAFAMGKAVVSTSIGAEGIDVENKKEVLLADTPCNFARCIAFLLDNSEMRMRLGENAAKKVLGLYNWDIVCRQTVKEYQDALYQHSHSYS